MLYFVFGEYFYKEVIAAVEDDDMMAIKFDGSNFTSYTIHLNPVSCSARRVNNGLSKSVVTIVVDNDRR